MGLGYLESTILLMRNIVVIAHNIRSTHNVGSLLRTAEGMGVKTVYLTGYTPYPLMQTEKRLPHIAKKLDKQIAKTALGAEKLVQWKYAPDIHAAITQLIRNGYIIAALEQTATAISLPDFKVPPKIALIIGREVEGIEPEVLDLASLQIMIPMFGKKESFNVVQAAAMAIFYCRFA